MYKISKTKAGIKINGQLLGDSTLEKNKYLSSSKDNNSSRPSLVREFERVRITSDIELDIPLLTQIIPELNTSKLTQEDFEEKLNLTDACFYNRSTNANWGNKAISLLLNNFFSIDIFTY